MLILPIFEYIEHEIPPSPKRLLSCYILLDNNSINKKTPCKHERVFSLLSIVQSFSLNFHDFFLFIFCDLINF